MKDRMLENDKHVTDYSKEIRNAGGELRQGNWNNNRGCNPYYVIVDPYCSRWNDDGTRLVQREYAGYFVWGLGDNPIEHEHSYECHRGGAFWNVPKDFYEKYKELFALVDKLEKEFPRTFQAIQAMPRRELMQKPFSG